jgi:hypothetical protein
MDPPGLDYGAPAHRLSISLSSTSVIGQLSGDSDESRDRTASLRVAKMSVIGVMYEYCIFHSSSVVQVLLGMHPQVRKHSLLPICCRVHVHPSSGLPTASTRPSILTSRSCLLLWFFLHVSCCCITWVFRRSWRRTRRRTALRTLLVNGSCIIGVSLETYRGRAEHR